MSLGVTHKRCFPIASRCATASRISQKVVCVTVTSHCSVPWYNCSFGQITDGNEARPDPFLKPELPVHKKAPSTALPAFADPRRAPQTNQNFVPLDQLHRPAYPYGTPVPYGVQKGGVASDTSYSAQLKQQRALADMHNTGPTQRSQTVAKKFSWEGMWRSVSRGFYGTPFLL